METRKRILWERSPGTNCSFRKCVAIFTVLGQCRSQLSTQRTRSFCLWHVTKAKWIHSERLTEGFVTELQIQTYTWWISLLSQSTRRTQGPELRQHKSFMETQLYSLFSFSLSCGHSQGASPPRKRGAWDCRAKLYTLGCGVWIWTKAVIVKRRWMCSVFPVKNSLPHQELLLSIPSCWWSQNPTGKRKPKGLV